MICEGLLRLAAADEQLVIMEGGQGAAFSQRRVQSGLILHTINEDGNVSPSSSVRPMILSSSLLVKSTHTSCRSRPFVVMIDHQDIVFRL